MPAGTWNVLLLRQDGMRNSLIQWSWGRVWISTGVWKEGKRAAGRAALANGTLK